MARQTQATHRGAPPLSRAAAELLHRADGELFAARLNSDDSERFVHGHMAALRAAGAVVAARATPVRRRAPRAVWDQLAVLAPELAGWSTYFASGAGLRAAVEAGGAGLVSPERSGELVAAAEDFVDEVRMLLELGQDPRTDGVGDPRSAPAGVS